MLIDTQIEHKMGPASTFSRINDNPPLYALTFHEMKDFKPKSAWLSQKTSVLPTLPSESLSKVINQMTSLVAEARTRYSNCLRI